MKTVQTVTYTGATIQQINWGSNDDPRDLFVVGQSYETEEINVRSSHTKVKFNDIEGWFNSVSFDTVDIEPGMAEFYERHGLKTQEKRVELGIKVSFNGTEMIAMPVNSFKPISSDDMGVKKSEIKEKLVATPFDYNSLFEDGVQCSASVFGKALDNYKKWIAAKTNKTVIKENPRFEWSHSNPLWNHEHCNCRCTTKHQMAAYFRQRNIIHPITVTGVFVSDAPVEPTNPEFDKYRNVGWFK